MFSGTVMNRISISLLACIFLINTPLFSSIEPSLQEMLDALPPDSAVSVIVVMKDRVSLDALRFDYARSGADFRGRHERAMVALREKATLTQRPILEFLEASARGGKALEIHPFWLVNAIRLKARPEVIRACSARGDVDRVELDGKVRLQNPVTKSAAPPASQGFEPNLGVIGADALWRLGYRGEGVLVCTLDSGIDRNHGTLSEKWRGTRGFPYAECWFDPFNHSNTPRDDDADFTHGTGVMSVILGSSGADTLGVAPGATWIAANAFEADVGGSQVTTDGVLLECFEWAADPDGDPSTEEDVPRVLNSSWGTNLTNGGGACEDILYDAIDAVEVLGTAVFFSAGNTGPASLTIASPGSRITTPVNAFAVGAVTNTLAIASFSSRGPSTCDNTTFKPEVVAPGSNIRVARGSEAGGGYHVLSGTSFSTPHVSGAAALLCQVNPALTAEEVKYALLNSAVDLGNMGDDNTFGMGVIDLPSALALVGNPGVPALSILDIDYRDPDSDGPEPGESVDIVITIRNGGTALSDLQASLATGDPLVSVTQAGASFGDLGRGSEASNGGSPFAVQISDTYPNGQSVSFSLALSWSGGGSATLGFAMVVGSDPGGGSGEHDVGNVTFTVTNFGQYGYYNGARTVGEGFRFPSPDPGDGTNWLFHGAFLAATGPSSVSDGTEGGGSDWRVLPGGNLAFTAPGEIADQEGYAAFGDDGADTPLGLQVLQRSFAFSDNVNSDFVLLVYFLINSSPMDTLSNLYTGLYFDWDLDGSWYDRNDVDWLPELSLGYMWADPDLNPNLSLEEYVGMSLLSHEATSYRAVDNPTYVYDGFTDAEKYGFMSGGFSVTRGGTLSDWSQLLSVGPFALGPMDTLSVVYAVLGGESFSDLRDNAEAARGKYEDIKDLLPLVIIPPTPPTPLIGEIPLAQNYPNPYLSADGSRTTIWYRVYTGAESVEAVPVTLKVYDLRGRLVKTLVDREAGPGDYSIEWDGKDDQGKAVPSGVYLYRFEQERVRVEVNRKLILIH